MHLEIEENPNCQGTSLMVFESYGQPKILSTVALEKGGKVFSADVVGISKEGKPVQAFSQKIADSGAGTGFLIFGSDWGIRFREATHTNQPWDLKNAKQWGEPFMVYADEEGLTFGRLK